MESTAWQKTVVVVGGSQKAAAPTNVSAAAALIHRDTCLHQDLLHQGLAFFGELWIWLLTHNTRLLSRLLVGHLRAAAHEHSILHGPGG